MFTQDDIISVYTTDQAIEDGVLAHLYPEKYPYLLLTAGVLAKCEAEAERSGRTLDQVVVPLMQDVVLQIRKEMRRRADVNLVKLHHTAADTVWATPNDKGGVTIMNPEDY